MKPALYHHQFTLDKQRYLSPWAFATVRETQNFQLFQRNQKNGF